MSYTRSKTGVLDQLTGVGKVLGPTQFLYLVGGLALAGIPPMNGFISKVALIRGGIDTEQWVTLGLVVGGGILTLLYITRTYSRVFQSKRNADSVEMKSPLEGDSVIAPAMLLSIAFIIGLNANMLINVVDLTVDQMLEPAQYINAVLGALIP